MKEPISGLITEENMCLFWDYYEGTMGKSDLDHKNNNIETENYFIRKAPQGSYIITAGLEQVVHFIKKMHFNEEILGWLKRESERDFSDEFIDYLRNFKFKGDIYAVLEGTPIFPNEPIINITGNSIDIQLIETYLLNVMNFQSLVATKTSRIVNAAKNREIYDDLNNVPESKLEKFINRTSMEFGARRAHGRDAAILGARAAYIAGATGTSLTLAGYLFKIQFIGTMAHKYVQSRPNELQAFREYAQSFPYNAILLIDTYDTIQGAKNAVIVGKELEKKGQQLKGVRLDSGDILELSKKVRKILDDAGLNYAKIFASNDLDEFIIEDLIKKGAPIDGFGVGTRLITGANYNSITKTGGVSAMPGVYKLVERIENEKIIPKMKFSDDSGKEILPSKKQAWRICNEKGNYVKDIITIWNEKPDLKDYQAKPLLVPIMKNGELVYDFPEVKDIQKYCLEELKKIPNEYKKISGAKEYPVEISPKLIETIKNFKEEYKKQNG